MVRFNSSTRPNKLLKSIAKETLGHSVTGLVRQAEVVFGMHAEVVFGMQK